MTVLTTHRKSLFFICAAVIIAFATMLIWQLTRADTQPKAEDNCKTISTRSVCASFYVGLSETEAIAKAKKDGVESRVVSRDGQDLIIDLSLRTDRINFSTTNGRITKVEFY